MAADGELIQIVDAALAEANRRAGVWLACRPGCTECCIGPFPITQLDAVRLSGGLAELAQHDPARAARVRERARRAVEAMAADFPGDARTGILDDDEAAGKRFATLAESAPCPALDPGTGMCDLYAARPITCRTFGPALRWEQESLGVCELNFRGASDEEIADCEVVIGGGELEAELAAELPPGDTIVAFALLR
ncbi:MAG TPA: YkgJ family cysteine cluster protein [Candidatus Sulfopaludibacter sp.]|nr:YkgJ family cysteine cluster protein [Candidatus Sulfopaludibacter sp.]